MPAIKMKFRQKVRFVIRGIIIAVFAWFFVHDLNPSGVLEVSYNLCKPSPYISEFSPHGRVAEIKRTSGYCEQEMAIDPVYVDVRLPQRYDRVRVTMEYSRPADQQFNIGVRTSLTAWAWHTIEFEEGETHTRGSAQFKLQGIPLDRRRLRFILSAPGLSAHGQHIGLRNINFRFEKPPFSARMVKRWLGSFIDGHL